MSSNPQHPKIDTSPTRPMHIPGRYRVIPDGMQAGDVFDGRLLTAEDIANGMIRKDFPGDGWNGWSGI